MKKLTAIIGLCGIALGTFGQGAVNFNNSSTTEFRTNAVGLGGTAGNATPIAGSWYYALLTAPSTVTSVDPNGQQLLTSTWTFTGIYATNTIATSGGRMAGGTFAPTSAGWPAGDTNSFVVVGYSPSLGHDWTAIAAELQGAFLLPSNGSFMWCNFSSYSGPRAFFGISAVGNALAGGGTTGLVSGTLFGPPAFGFSPIGTPTDLYIVACPEPPAFAIGAVGASVALILYRRWPMLVRSSGSRQRA